MSVVSGPRARFALTAVLAWALHMAAVFQFVAPSALFSRQPIDGFDYDTHIGQVLRVGEGLARWGETWVYDVQLLAGQPEGTLFDADNKGWELWTFVLWRLGLPEGFAFNSFVLVSHALVPVAIAFSCACFGLGRWASLLAFVFASCVWLFDSWLHWAWCIGMVSYASASAGSMLVLGLFYRFTTAHSLWAGLLFVPTLALCHLLHPYSFFILAVPLTVQYLWKRRSLRGRDHGIVIAAVVATLLLNGVWLIPALRHWHYLLDSAYFGRTSLGHFAADFFNLALDFADSGVIGTRAAFRFLFLGLSCGAVVVMFRERLQRRVMWTTAFVCLFVFGYMGSYLPGGSQVQPYRHVMPLTLIAAMGAADFVRHLVSVRALSGVSPAGFALLGLLGLGTFQHLVGDILYFIPERLPQVALMIDGTKAPFDASGHRPVEGIYRIPSPMDEMERRREVSSWIASNVENGARVLIEDPHLGEHVAWSAKVEVLGGFRYRNIAHAFANFYRPYERKLVDKATLRSYLRTYAVEWVVAGYRRRDFEQFGDLLKLEGQLEKRFLYKTRMKVSKVLSGGGRVTGSTNRIELAGSDPQQPAILSYHFHEQLVCAPKCRVERHEIPFDEVGLVRIPAPHPADLTITLKY